MPSSFDRSSDENTDADASVHLASALFALERARRATPSLERKREILNAAIPVARVAARELELSQAATRARALEAHRVALPAFTAAVEHAMAVDGRALLARLSPVERFVLAERLRETPRWLRGHGAKP